jgi:hypothetical protein
MDVTQVSIHAGYGHPRVKAEMEGEILHLTRSVGTSDATVVTSVQFWGLPGNVLDEIDALRSAVVATIEAADPPLPFEPEPPRVSAGAVTSHARHRNEDARTDVL